MCVFMQRYRLLMLQVLALLHVKCQTVSKVAYVLILIFLSATEIFPALLPVYERYWSKRWPFLINQPWSGNSGSTTTRIEPNFKQQTTNFRCTNNHRNLFFTSQAYLINVVWRLHKENIWKLERWRIHSLILILWPTGSHFGQFSF